MSHFFFPNFIPQRKSKLILIPFPPNVIRHSATLQPSEATQRNKNIITLRELKELFSRRI